MRWDVTTAVAVTLHAAGYSGLGWTYSSPVAADIVEQHLRPIVDGARVADIDRGWQAMHRAGRNFGTRGLYLQAMSAVDIAWWDLKARVLGCSLPDLLGRCHDQVPVYGSGGFTTMSDAELAAQVDEWKHLGCTAMKIKIGQAWGTCIDRDLGRAYRLRELAGPAVEIMVDANGGYTVGQARRVGAALDEIGVTWFEEPVSSDDTDGLAAVRAALRCDVTAGEYAADVYDVRALLPVIDCLQLDATRCGGYTGWRACAALARAHNLSVSAHCAPALHTPIAMATGHLRHIEYFADHARLEPELVIGAPTVIDGHVTTPPDVFGHGMSLAA